MSRKLILLNCAPKTGYNTIYVYTGVYISLTCVHHILFTVPSGPPIYLRGHSINPAGLHILWSRPKLLDCNGDILQYIIVVDNGLDTRNYTFNVTRECISRTCTNIECMSHSFTASENNELVPHNKYSVKIAAVNVNGTGPFSSAIEVMSGDNGKV